MGSSYKTEGQFEGGFLMAGKKGLGLVVLLVILILINVILSYANIRWDVTQDKIYSLSSGTENILSNLTEPVTIKFFYSKSNRNFPSGLKLYAKRVREFLSEYEHGSKGKVRVEVYDPRIDSDEEEWAQKYGIRTLSLSSGERIYCGLVFLAGGQEEKIEWLDPSREELLEYDTTRIIVRLQTPKKKLVGVISSLPVFGTPQGPAFGGLPYANAWLFITELKKTYEVKEIKLTEKRIDRSVALLVMVHPKGLTQQLQYAIDQYILSGRNALVFVDPFCISDPSRGRQGFMQPTSSSLERLFAAWGISMDSKKAIADFDQSTRVRTQSNIVESNPTWISARGNAFSKSDVLTSRLESMLFPVAGAVRKIEEGTFELKPLVQSGKNSELIDAFKANFGADAIRKDFLPSDEHLNIAVSVHGKFKTAFPAGPPKDEKPGGDQGNGSGEVHLNAGKDKAALVIVGDVDMLADRFYVRSGSLMGFDISRVFNDNLNFLSNACEILTGSDDLIGIRSRGRFERPFNTVLDLKKRAQERWLAKEKELIKRVEMTNQRLRELEKQKDVSQRLILSPEQEAEIAEFKDQKRRINRELKEVRKKLRADIDSLGVGLKSLNVFLMPLLVSLSGILFAIYRQRRIRRP
jgi:ABC-type uncharacterized transport system involved in gliding motility auxiliary subunit